ncbi:MAG: DNRLRE domain-containing protein [Saprospiraceae bacterium]
MKPAFYLPILALFIFSGFSAFSQEIVVLNPTTTDIDDATIVLLSPDVNYGDDDELSVYTWTHNGELNKTRSLLRFDMSAIPAEAEILDATLILYFNTVSTNGSQHSGENNYYIQRVVSPWDEETVTWNSQPFTTQLNRVEVPEPPTPTRILWWT